MDTTNQSPTARTNGFFGAFIDFFKISAPNYNANADKAKFNRIRLTTFISATCGYALYYVCRLSMNIVRKPIVDDGVFSETQLGIIGSCLFFVYAVGKLANGFLADRCNVRRFMATGLLLTAIVNLVLGMTEMFWVFALLWGLNGWFQSMGAPAGVVSLNRWYDNKDRGTFYGFWSASHNLGEAITFITIAILVGLAGWRSGMIGAGVIGVLGFFMLLLFMRDTPQSQGYLLGGNDAVSQMSEKLQKSDFNSAQKAVLRNKAIWILALASAFMYISRYAVNSWGVFYLEAQKGYSNLDASFIISISSICGIVGTVASGIISDKLFGGSRNVPALVFGLMNVTSLCLFLLVPGNNIWVDATAMVLFGLGIGVLICFLGGLMAVDIAPKAAAGAALGVVGIASYIGAGLQDVMNGVLIEGYKAIDASGNTVYDFTYVNWFWIGSALLSVVLTLLVWNAKRADD
ncbi:MFS transporter [uncultured Muribaculum sp.]|uniref:MFS transporter n=1 Tax=uncultured Muribaculum sp. TaxID=1918613 RepID=UPI0025A9E61F|nr:MFS transporter [uncultured Muribaculum sp.]